MHFYDVSFYSSFLAPCSFVGKKTELVSLAHGGRLALFRRLWSNDAVQRGATDKKGGGGRDGGGELGQKLTVDRCRIYISQSAGARIVEIFLLISCIYFCFFFSLRIECIFLFVHDQRYKDFDERVVGWRENRSQSNGRQMKAIVIEATAAVNMLLVIFSLYLSWVIKELRRKRKKRRKPGPKANSVSEYTLD